MVDINKKSKNRELSKRVAISSTHGANLIKQRALDLLAGSTVHGVPNLASRKFYHKALIFILKHQIQKKIRCLSKFCG